MWPARVYYAACRHVHVRKIFEVLFRVFESQPVNLFHSSRTLSKSVNSYICLSDFNWTLWSVLWRCWLGDRKGIRPVKNEWWCAGVVICLERGADLHMAQLMPLPLTVSCFSEIQIGFTFLVLAHLGSPGKRAIIRVCVCVSVVTLYVNSVDKTHGYYH